MKFQQIAACEKHLSEAFQGHLARIYLIGCPHEPDRKQIASLLYTQICRKEIAVTFEVVSDLNKLLEKLSTHSLFGGTPVLFFDGVDQLNKKELERLEKAIIQPSPLVFLILGGKNDSGLYTKAKKEAVYLDLSQEKPWDREKRLKEWCASFAFAEKKQLGFEVIPFLLEEIGADWPALQQELFKLSTYVGEKPHITLADARVLCSRRTSLTGWQIAEGIVWGEHFDARVEDLNALIPLIGQIRYQLELGLQICYYLRKGENPGSHLPSVRPQTMEKCISAVKKKGVRFFKNGLSALFELDVSTKSTSLTPNLMLTHFIGRLQSYAHTFAQSSR